MAGIVHRAFRGRTCVWETCLSEPDSTVLRPHVLVPRAHAWALGSLGVWSGVWVQLQQASVATWPVWVVACALAWIGWGLGSGWRPFRAAFRSSVWRSHHTLARGHQRRVWVVWLGWWLLGASLAWALTDARAAWRLGVTLPAAIEGQPVQIQGKIVDLPQWSADGVRFGFEVERAWLETRRGGSLQALVVQDLPRELLLSWTVPPWARAGGAEVPDDLRAGQRWRLPVRLRRPHGLLNPWGFDRELWLFAQDWRATGSVRSGRRVHAERLGDSGCCVLQTWREGQRQALRQSLGDGRSSGVLAALVLGDQGAIDSSDWDLFRRTGVAHLMAISGLHLTLLAWGLARGVSWVWSRSRRAVLWVPAPSVGRAAGWLGALLYAVLAGWGVPAQRTVLMLALVGMSRALGLRWPGLWGLSMVGSVVLLLDPWALLQPGFWLSFAAVGLLMWSADAEGTTASVNTWRARLGQAWHTQWVATVGLLPWTAVLFQQVSVVGLLANLVAVPWVTLVVTPLALAGTVFRPLWSGAALALEVLDPWLQTLSAWPWASLSLAAAPAWAWCAGVGGGLLLVSPLPWGWKGVGVAGLIPLLVPVGAAPEPGRFHVTALDIGQGTSVLVRTARHSLLYDTGPVWGSESDAGDRVIVPYLKALGLGPLDALVLSHRDADHTGGAGAVLLEIGVRHQFSALEPGHPLRAKGPHQPCTAGLKWEWDGVPFEMLHPTSAQLDAAWQSPGWKPNTLSCVLRIGTSPDAVLLTGDIEREQELTMSNLKERQLRSAVLLVPHHGSRTSSSPALLKAVSPHWAVIQAGFGNRYGHPADEVVDRYLGLGVNVVRSDRCGAWHWSGALRGGRCERELRRRYWHDPGQAPAREHGPEVANSNRSTENLDQP